MTRRQLSLPLLLALALACGDDDPGSAEDASVPDAAVDLGTDAAMDDGAVDDAGEEDGAADEGAGGDASCDDLVALFVNAPDTVTESDCALENGSTTTCCTLTFGSDVMEDGPYCPASRTSPAPYGLSVYDGATRPGLRPFNGDYLDDIVADGYDPMFDDAGNTNIVTGLGGGGPGEGSNCLALDQDFGLTIEVNVPLVPTLGDAASELGEVENYGVSVMGIPATGDPPSATMGPMMGMGGGGGGTAINVPSIGSCGAHPDPGGYLHDHFIPQVMNAVLESQGIGPDEVECTRYVQDTTTLYGFAKDGFPIYSSRNEDGSLPELDECNGEFGPTPDFPDGIYHYHAVENAAPNVPPCLRGVPVRQSFRYF
ncbi:MAG: YHYH protein [Myxococcota bacterium]